MARPKPAKKTASPSKTRPKPAPIGKTASAKKLLWITDPWSTLDHAKDTSLRLIEESLILGTVSYWCDVKTIRFEGGRVVLTARKIESVDAGRASEAFKLARPETCPPSEFTHIFYRTDPPVDLAYLLPLQLLEMGLREAKHSRLVNAAATLFRSNEKLEAAALSDLFPRAIVSSEREKLEKFLDQEKIAVLKPLFQAQSKGVKVLDLSKMTAAQLSAAFLEPTEGFKLPAILQQYLPGIEKGEQRLWFVNGKLLAAARKLPKAGEVVIDMDRGGQVVATELDDREKKAVQKIGRYLASEKIEWAAVDLIDGLVTDFNFTSPGLIVAMEAALARNLAREILEMLE